MAKARDCKSLIPGSNPGAASKLIYARVAELADAQDLKSCEAQPSYRFDSGLGHHFKLRAARVLWLVINGT